MKQKDIKMIENKELLTEAEAQQIAEKYLLAKYFQSKLDFGDIHLIDKDNVRVYQLQGKITMQSRGTLDRFTVPRTANSYDFKIEVEAHQGQVLGYEFT
ncbi:MAG: hypothetical protein ISS52_03535 [Dehalococcoidia bacterium]|nr:hypothetical protein [Dehalococcoidia bacterium]